MAIGKAGHLGCLGLGGQSSWNHLRTFRQNNMSSDAKCPQKSFPPNDLQIDLSKIDPPKEPITTSESHHTSRTSRNFCSKVAHPFPSFSACIWSVLHGCQLAQEMEQEQSPEMKNNSLSLNSTTFNYISMRVLARSNFEGCLAM